jgi:hypothetical protein
MAETVKHGSVHDQPGPAGVRPRAFQITKGRGRLYFDPATGFIRMDHAGAGPTMELTREEMIALSRALWYAARG